MKLRNKKTGEIVDVESLGHEESLKEKYGHQVTLSWYCMENLDQCKTYNSLAELNEEWEDYEENEYYWYIDDIGIASIAKRHNDKTAKRKAIGNYFETEEEAERAVEKLKALTEAKKDGLVIKGYYYNHDDLVVLADIGNCNKLTLDTLFGKEID